MARVRAIGLGLLLAAAWFGGPAAAATLVALDLGELVRASEHIVLAKAESRDSRKDEATGLIVTDVRLRVITKLKGGSQPGQTLVATVLGGSVGELGLQVPGEAVLPDDHSAIVFLRKNQLGELNVTGMSQGVLTIVGEGGSAMAMPGGAGAELVQRGSDGRLRDAPDALMQPRSLAAVLTEIRGLVSAGE